MSVDTASLVGATVVSADDDLIILEKDGQRFTIEADGSWADGPLLLVSYEVRP